MSRRLAVAALMLFVAVVAVVPLGMAQSGAQEHSVRAGDTLWSIARRYGCSTAAIELANPRVRADRLQIGQRIEIPPCDGSDRAAAKARPEKSGKSSELGASASAAASERRHKVRAGDYLERIAERYECSVEAIQRANGLRSDVIYAGSTLVIPRCDGTDAAPAPAASSPEPAPARRTPSGKVDHVSLAKLMRARGFHPPSKFKAYVHLVEFDSGRNRVIREQAWDWEGTSDDISGWNPASSVKLFAAVGALMRVEKWGFGPKAKVVFHSRGGDQQWNVQKLVEEAVGPSNNIAYNYLVLLSGWDWLHDTLFTKRFSLDGTALRRAYERRKWMNMGESPSFQESPPITLTEGAQSKRLPAREGHVDVKCYSAACASLASLAECMRRLMLQEQLPRSETFGLSRDNLLLLRQALRTDRKRGEEVVDALSKHFDGDKVRLYHKAGYSQKWYSDVVYIYDPSRPRAWIVALAGYPGRASLNSAADIIGDLMAERALR